jgi:hypothetical protein
VRSAGTLVRSGNDVACPCVGVRVTECTSTAKKMKPPRRSKRAGVCVFMNAWEKAKAEAWLDWITTIT